MDQKLVRDLLDYDPETGVLTWRVRDRRWFASDRVWKSWNARFAGKPAGCVGGRGYIVVSIFRRLHQAHRLIWLWMTGEFPSADTDHINHVTNDNRWSNLREVTHATNCKNLSTQTNNTSGVTGVYWLGQRSKWHARIIADGRNRFLGYFANKDDAIAARKAAERLHGFHPNHGRVSALPAD